MSLQLKNKRVVISGGAGGLGMALCNTALQRGAKVISLDLAGEGLEKQRKTHSANSSFESHVIDICNDEAVAALCNTLKDVDVLINNAGITDVCLFEDIDLQKLRKVIEVNVLGTANLTYGLLPGIVKNKGNITVLSSVAGYAPLIGRSAYSASKHALAGMFKTLRTELEGSGTDVLMVFPSSIDTAIRKNAGSSDDADSNAGDADSPESVAAKIFDAIQRGERRLFPSSTSKKAYWLNAIFPRIYEKIMLKRYGVFFSKSAKAKGMLEAS